MERGEGNQNPLGPPSRPEEMACDSAPPVGPFVSSWKEDATDSGGVRGCQ